MPWMVESSMSISNVCDCSLPSKSIAFSISGLQAGVRGAADRSRGGGGWVGRGRLVERKLFRGFVATVVVRLSRGPRASSVWKTRCPCAPARIAQGLQQIKRLHAAGVPQDGSLPHTQHAHHARALVIIWTSTTSCQVCVLSRRFEDDGRPLRRS
jgi:hypothetical protein